MSRPACSATCRAPPRRPSSPVPAPTRGALFHRGSPPSSSAPASPTSSAVLSRWSRATDCDRAHHTKALAVRPGLFYFSEQRGLRRDARLLEGRHLRGKVVEPLHQPRMTRAPFPLEAQIAAAERAGEPDPSDIRERIEWRW